VEIDFERAVRDEKRVRVEQTALDALLEDVGEVIDLQRRIDASARRSVLASVVARVRPIASARGDDQVPQALSARSERDVERGVAADRTKRQRPRVVVCERRCDIGTRAWNAYDESSCA
jgi:hypothetical protein